MMAQQASISARVSYSVSKDALSRRSAPKRAMAARRVAAVTAEARPVWFPGGEPAEHLDGSLPGDYGFDPLGLGAEPERLKWMQQAELMHCRWAMAGFAGMVLPDAATKAGVLDLPPWFEAGAAEMPFSGLTIFWTQMILMNWVEVRRWQDFKNPGCVNEDPIFKGQGFECTGTEVGYPGGKWFNPLSFATTEEQMASYKLKEIKNGRLAMVATVGLAAQAFATGESPVTNYLAHLSDPGHTTIFQAFGL